MVVLALYPSFIVVEQKKSKGSYLTQKVFAKHDGFRNWLKRGKKNIKFGIFWSSSTGLVYLGNKLTKMTFDQKPLSDCKVGYFDF